MGLFTEFLGSINTKLYKSRFLRFNLQVAAVSSCCYLAETFSTTPALPKVRNIQIYSKTPQKLLLNRINKRYETISPYFAFFQLGQISSITCCLSISPSSLTVPEVSKLLQLPAIFNRDSRDQQN